MQIGDLIKQAKVFSSYPRSVASVLETGWMLIAVVGLLTVGEGAAGYYKDLNSLGGGTMSASFHSFQITFVYHINHITHYLYSYLKKELITFAPS